MKCLKLWKLIITGTIQGTTNSIFDTSTTINRDIDTGKENWRAKGICMILKPWLKNKYGEYLPQFGLVIGWIKS